jgi:hypothetical protein
MSCADGAHIAADTAAISYASDMAVRTRGASGVRASRRVATSDLSQRPRFYSVPPSNVAPDDVNPVLQRYGLGYTDTECQHQQGDRTITFVRASSP